MRSEFEKIEWVNERLNHVWWSQEKGYCDTGKHPRANASFLNGAWSMYQNQQSKVDELQKKNAWLSDVAERENKRAKKLQEENVNTTVLLGKTIQEKNEMQKRADEALKMLDQFYCEGNLDSLEKAEKALKGCE